MSTVRPIDPPKVALAPRDVQWDWDNLPRYYVDDSPFLTHFVNSFNMLLPEAEIFIVQLFQQALELVTDDEVRRDMIGFIGQEATHSAAHQSLLDHLAQEQLDVEPFMAHARWLFHGLLGDRNITDPARAQSWIRERAAIVAAIEHFTSYLGDWGLNAAAWRTGFEPRVLDLVLWHLAEEVEHRHVAFDVAKHLDDSYFRRIRAYLFTMPPMLLFILRGTHYMCTIDPQSRSNPLWVLREARRGWRAGMLPTPWSLTKMFFAYFRPGYHPAQYGSTSQAAAYLASSPAARAAR